MDFKPQRAGLLVPELQGLGWAGLRWEAGALGALQTGDGALCPMQFPFILTTAWFQVCAEDGNPWLSPHQDNHPPTSGGKQLMVSLLLF